MSDTQSILDRAGKVLIGNYARQPIVMSRGEGSLLWDTNGKQYIDLFAGFGGAILGHCHPELVKAIGAQSQKLWHVGNTFHTEPQVEFAERLVKHTFPSQAFFCHSGLEANEAACKLARLRGSQATGTKRWKIVSFNHSFHGRSLAMISATGNPAVKAGFEPMVPGFTQVEPGDIDVLSNAVDDETAGIIIEPIQGEGGIHLHTSEFIAQVRALCDQKGLSLIFDEVWTGCGRTGRWFGYQYFMANGKVIEPDILTLGKAIGGGLPVGAMLAKPDIARLLVPGKHGCTLGGNPICMSAGRTIMEVIDRDNLVARASSLGEKAMSRLANDSRIKHKIAQVRGRGLMLGVELKEAPQKIVDKGLERGVVLNLTASKIIRLAPALNITDDLWDKGLELVIQTIAS
jgi:predicted acetylornithine/succinylornithine family transaminase